MTFWRIASLQIILVGSLRLNLIKIRTYQYRYVNCDSANRKK